MKVYTSTLPLPADNVLVKQVLANFQSCFDILAKRSLSEYGDYFCKRSGTSSRGFFDRNTPVESRGVRHVCHYLLPAPGHALKNG